MISNAIDGKRAAQRTWGRVPTGKAEGARPGTVEFFERARAYRSEVEQPWLHDVVPFRGWTGKRVLEIGFGPGFDALDIIQSGADYTGIDITPENVERTKAHLAPYGIDPDVWEGDAEAMDLPDASFDVVYSNGVLHHTPDMERAFREVHRVLKPGGEFHVVLYHRRSIFYYVTLGLWHQIIHGGWRRETLAERVRRIERGSHDGELPVVNTYTRSEVRRILRASGLEPTGTHVRKLTPADLPAVWFVHRFFDRIPRQWYETVGRAYGWYVIASARKP